MLEFDRAPMSELPLQKACSGGAVSESDLALDLYDSKGQRSLHVSGCFGGADLNHTYLPIPPVLRDTSVLRGPWEPVMALPVSLGRGP